MLGCPASSFAPQPRGLFVTFERLGAIVAFLTGAFVLWDRLVSGRPIATIVKSGRDLRDLQLMNTSKSEILIRRIKVWGSAAVVLNRSVDGMVGALVPVPFSAVIE